MANTTTTDSDDIINRQIVVDILQREGGAKVTNNPADRGGRTQYGIAEASNPKAWLDQKVTLEEATDIYLSRYLEAPGFGKIKDPRLRAQVVDFGVNSGPGIVTVKLQQLTKMEPDGILGPKSLAAINAADPMILGNKLALERIKMIGRIVNKNPSQATFLNGWIARALEFIRL